MMTTLTMLIRIFFIIIFPAAEPLYQSRHITVVQNLIYVRFLEVGFYQKAVSLRCVM